MKFLQRRRKGPEACRGLVLVTHAGLRFDPKRRRGLTGRLVSARHLRVRKRKLAWMMAEQLCAHVSGDFSSSFFSALTSVASLQLSGRWRDEAAVCRQQKSDAESGVEGLTPDTLLRARSHEKCIHQARFDV